MRLNGTNNQIADKVVEEMPNPTETILLVENYEVLDVCKEMIKAIGYKVLSAESGKEAIEIYNENRDKIDLVILGMNMPEMGIGKAYDRMKEVNPYIRVLLSIGYAIQCQVTEIFESGCNGVILKPFNMKQLSQSIRKVLEKRCATSIQ